LNGLLNGYLMVYLMVIEWYQWYQRREDSYGTAKSKEHLGCEILGANISIPQNGKPPWAYCRGYRYR
jgi:hypothetical protein